MRKRLSYSLENLVLGATDNKTPWRGIRLLCEESIWLLSCTADDNMLNHTSLIAPPIGRCPMQEVESLSSEEKLRISSELGPNGLSSILLKCGSSSLLIVTTVHVNKSIAIGVLLASWESATIVFIRKTQSQTFKQGKFLLLPSPAPSN